jgi:hypothetical protein
VARATVTNDQGEYAFTAVTPATYTVGRDGLVKSVHAGFPSPGSGELFKQEKAEFVDKVEQLLAGNQVSSR